MVFWVGHIYDPVEVVCRCIVVFLSFFETNKGVEGERVFFLSDHFLKLSKVSKDEFSF